ncbi:MAG: hypothetical protein DHS20C11_00610 [Lysobacteraceae bacterium]|nr:MAG: hypothetical protein DHS20C11_00610 [Xanthomonadaceae bacterium]
MVEKPSKERYDFAVIGSGPAGVSLALDLAERLPSARIALVESGGAEPASGSIDLSTLVATGDLAAAYYPTHAIRGFGGTTAVWEGYCTTLERRAFIAGEWPISFEELARHYPAALRFLDLPESLLASPVAINESFQYRPYHLSKVRVAETYLDAVKQAPSIELLTNWTCRELASGDHQVTHAELVHSLDPSQTSTLSAQHFVLACGGLGNSRLLLLSGLKPTLPALGEGFMEHPHVYGAGVIDLTQSVIDEVIANFPQTPDNKVVHAIQTTDQYALEHDLLSFAISFDTNNLVELSLLGERQRCYRSHAIFRAEMPSVASNQLSLSDKRDSLGQQRGAIHFEFPKAEELSRHWDHFSRQLLRSGLGRGTVHFAGHLTGGGHYIGTTRMGASSANSVVNENGKVHGLENLYVSGSSTFPAGGAANPTLTIVALSYRLAEHLQHVAGGVK